MKKSATVFLLMAISSIAFAEDITCQILRSGEVVNESTISVDQNAKVHYGKEGGYQFMLNNHGESKYEIEVFDSNGESRNYALGTLKTATDKISWTFWSRDMLIESSCTLASKFR